MASERIIPRLLAGLVLLATAAAASAGEAPPAPALEAPLMDGTHFSLAAERGHVVVLHLWASWCPPCRVEMPLLDRFARAHPKVRVIGLSYDRKRDMGAVMQAMGNMGLATMLAAEATRNGFGEARVLPQTLVIDPSGRITTRFAGGNPALTEAALDTAVRQAGI